jgi:hypothetical protein
MCLKIGKNNNISLYIEVYDRSKEPITYADMPNFLGRPHVKILSYWYENESERTTFVVGSGILLEAYLKS